MNEPSVSAKNPGMDAAKHRKQVLERVGVGIRLLKSVSVGCYDNIVMPVTTLTAIAVICGAVAVKTFRWE